MVTQKSGLSTLFAIGAMLLSCFSISCSAADKAANDDFDDPATIKAWTILKPNPRTDLFRRIDLGSARKGWLTVEPRAGNAWYNEGMGPMLYKEVEGDFLIETHAVTRSQAASSEAPRAHYNSAGLIVRDPASGAGKQNWVVVNVGRQDPDTGTEVKTTVNSKSQLELQRGSNSGRLRLGRIGSRVYCLSKLEGADRWTLIKEFERADLPAKVQLGLMCNGWTDQADLVAEFDYVRYSVPKGVGDLSANEK